MRLDEPLADGEAQSGAGPLPVAAADAIELVEDALEIVDRHARTFVAHLDDDAPVVAPAGDLDRRAGGRILRGVVEQIDQHLLHQHEVEREHRQVARERNRHAVIRKHLGATLQRRSYDIAEIDHLPSQLHGAGIDAGHVQQIRHERRPDSKYTSPAQVAFEVRSAEALFALYGIPYINTTECSIEEIASRIIERAQLERRLRP